MYLKILFVNYSRVGDGRAGGGVCVASKDRHPQLVFCTTHTQGAYNISKQCQNRGMFMFLRILLEFLRNFMRHTVKATAFISSFHTCHDNFNSKLISFKLVDSPWLQCLIAELRFEQSAHYVLWECDLSQYEYYTMLDNLFVSLGT